MALSVGSKIRMDGERTSYTVQAANDRFAIMTKPHFKTYLYTITDLQRRVRGPCNLVFGLPCHVDSPEGAREALAMIEAGEMEVSYRHHKDLTAPELQQLSLQEAA